MAEKVYQLEVLGNELEKYVQLCVDSCWIQITVDTKTGDRIAVKVSDQDTSDDDNVNWVTTNSFTCTQMKLLTVNGEYVDIPGGYFAVNRHLLNLASALYIYYRPY